MNKTNEIVKNVPSGSSVEWADIPIVNFEISGRGPKPGSIVLILKKANELTD